MICKIVLPPNDIYKLPAVPTSFEELHQITIKKFKDRLPEKFQFKYKDSEQDLITLSNDEDLLIAIKANESDSIKVLRILVIPEGAAEEREPLHMSLFDNTHLAYENTLNYNTINTPSFISSEGAGRTNSRQVVGLGRASSRTADTGSISGYKNHSFTSQMIMNNNYMMDRASMNSQKTSLSNARSMTFNFDRLSLMSQPTTKNEPITPENVFNYRQLEILSQMLDDKFNEIIEQKTLEAFQDHMKSNQNHNNTVQLPHNNNNLGYKIKITSESTLNSITGAMSKSSVPSYNHSGSGGKSNKKPKVKWGDEEWLCTLCDRKIQNIRYQCLECENFHCCESCEENVGHKHALLKDRFTKNQVDSDHETLDLSFNGSLRDTNEKFIPSHSSINRMGSLTTMTNKTSSDNTDIKEFKSIISNVSRFGKEAKPLKHSNTVHEIGAINSRKSEQVTSSRKRASFFDNNRLSVGGQKLEDSVKNYHHVDDYSSATSSGAVTPYGGESKKYKVQITKAAVFDLINVKCGEMYEFVICIKNLSQEWPSFVKLVCINGIHKGQHEFVPPLSHNQKYEMKLTLKAPTECGWHLSQWRLSYDEDTGNKLFGCNLFVEINVISPEGKNSNKEGPYSNSADDIRPFADKYIDKEDDIVIQKRKDKQVSAMDFLKENGITSDVLSRSMEMEVNSILNLNKSMEINSKKKPDLAI